MQENSTTHSSELPCFSAEIPRRAFCTSESSVPTCLQRKCSVKQCLVFVAQPSRGQAGSPGRQPRQWMDRIKTRPLPLRRLIITCQQHGHVHHTSVLVCTPIILAIPKPLAFAVIVFLRKLKDIVAE